MSSADLIWLLVKDNNSYLVKRNGVQWSREPGNLRNVNAFKYSGLAKAKVRAISWQFPEYPNQESHHRN